MNVKIKDKNTGKTILNTQVNSEQGYVYAATESVSSSVQKNFNSFENSKPQNQTTSRPTNTTANSGNTVKVQTTTTVTTTNKASNVSIKMKNPEEFYIGKVKNKAKHNSMYLRGSMNRWGLDNKIIMNRFKVLFRRE